MRCLQHPDESREQYHLHVDAFLHLEKSERDAEIQNARSATSWTEWISEY
jgi:hypothetical protein